MQPVKNLFILLFVLALAVSACGGNTVSEEPAEVVESAESVTEEATSAPAEDPVKEM